MNESNIHKEYEDLKITGTTPYRDNPYKFDHGPWIIKSYLDLRRFLGFLGISLPFILFIGSLIIRDGCDTFLPSISDYYHTSMRNIFVGVNAVIAAFLWCYKGYDKIETLISRIAAIFALIIAICPCPLKSNIVGTDSVLYFKDFQQCYVPCTAHPDLVGLLHFGSAIGFFVLLIYLVLIKFIEFEKKHHNNSKIICVYKTTAWLMGLSLIFIFCSLFFQWKPISIHNIVIPYTFAGESIALFAFGIAWLTKGELIYLDTKS